MQRFNVHKDVLISQSEPFRKAITGGWLETAERKINLDDWDGDTVGRLVEFLYTGDYHYSDPVSSGERVTERAVQRQLKDPRPARNDESKGPSRPLTPFDECLDTFLPQDRDDEADWSKLARFDSRDDYKDALLSHAKVYCLAQYKSVDALRILALRRVFLTLMKIDPLPPPKPDSSAVPSFIELANLVYSNTDSLVSSEEPLRKMVSQFAAHNLPALQSSPEMTDLMGEGDFVNDLMPKICRRLIPTPAVVRGPDPVHAPVRVPAPAPVPPAPNPTIGYFNTGEVHHWRDPWVQTSKIVSFGQTYHTPPGIPIGINTMDIGNNANIRINAYPTNIARDRFTIHLDSWQDTRMYSAGCTWLQIAATDTNFQFGRYNTTDYHSHHQTRTSRLITFPRAYSAPPTVVVMLCNLDLERLTGYRVRTYVTDVTARNFVIHVDTWHDTKVHSAAATWIAFPAGLPKVASGRFDTQNVRPLHPARLETSGHVGFAAGVFARGTTPRAMVAFDTLDLDCGRNARVKVNYDGMTAAGMNWHIDGWADTIVYSAGAAYIVLG